jgi:hypothetical protein
MSRVFILVSGNLTLSRRLDGIDEAVSEMVNSTEPDHRNRTVYRHEITKETLKAVKSGTVFELEHNPETYAPTSILTVLDI